jgi:cytoskeletal protein CcmA (bactofilin family)
MTEMTLRRPLLLLAALCYLLPAVSFGAQFLGESSYTLPADETRIGDFYYSGTMLRLEGRLDGSLIAGAQSISVTGPVTRNLFVAAQNIELAGASGGDVIAGCATLSFTGRVAGALRVGAGTVFLNGAVGEDVLAGCASLSVGRGAEVRGDVVAGCRTMAIAGTVRGDVKAVANEVTISGAVDGDVDVTVADRLTLTADARIYGNLRYRSDKKLDLGNPDLVFGNIEHVRLPGPREIEDIRNLRPRPSVFVTFLLPLTLLSILGALALGLILVAIWKHVLNEALNRSLNHWGRTIGFGAIGFLVGPMTILIALALIITIPAGLIALAAYLSCLYVGKILAGMLLGRLLFRVFRAPDVSLWAAAPLGIIIVWALCAIPYAGMIVWLGAIAVGFGIIAELLGMSRQP